MSHHILTFQCTGTDSDYLVDIGKDPPCTLHNCQGDCNTDDDCRDELQCFQRSDTNDIAPPGCTGNPKSNWDYCFKVAVRYSIFFNVYFSSVFENIGRHDGNILNKCSSLILKYYLTGFLIFKFDFIQSAINFKL